MENSIIDVLAEWFNLPASELLGNLQNPEKEGEPLAPAEIKTFLTGLYKEKVTTIEKGAAGKAVRDAKGKIARQMVADFSLERTHDVSVAMQSLASKLETANNSDNSNQEPQITKEQVTQHAEFKKLQGLYDTRATELATAVESLANEQTGRKKDKVWSKSRQYIEQLVRAKNPILSTDPDTARRQMQSFVNQFQSLSLGMDDSGKPFLIDDNGEQKVDDKYNPINFDTHVLGHALFDFAKVDPDAQVPGKTPGGNQPPTKKGWSDTDLQTMESYETKRKELDQSGDKAAVSKFDKEFQELHL